MYRLLTPGIPTPYTFLTLRVPFPYRFFTHSLPVLYLFLTYSLPIAYPFLTPRVWKRYTGCRERTGMSMVIRIAGHTSRALAHYSGGPL